MNNTNIYKIGLLVMLLVNGLLIFMMLRGPQMPPPSEAGLMGKISEKLELNEEQEAKYFELAQEHRNQVAQLEAKQRDMVKNYFDNLKTSDSSGQEAILAQIENLEGEKITVTYRHFEDLKSLCKESQLAHFDEIIEDVLRVLVSDQKKSNMPPRDR
jgi:periplasmic protein CpxP/Spy